MYTILCIEMYTYTTKMETTREVVLSITPIDEVIKRLLGHNYPLGVVYCLEEATTLIGMTPICMHHAYLTKSKRPRKISCAEI
jgi:hypothetical protein